MQHEYGHEQASVRLRVIGMINAGERLSPKTRLTHEGSAGAEVSCRQDPSLEDVLIDIINFGSSRLARQFTAMKLVRRRSVTDSIRLGLETLWDDVEAHLGEYRAAMILQTTRPDLLANGPTGTVALGRLPLSWALRWLTQMGQLQDVTWNTPVPVLARLMVATLNGLIADTSCRTREEDTRRLLGVIAYQLAQHSTRNHRPRTQPLR